MHLCLAAVEKLVRRRIYDSTVKHLPVSLFSTCEHIFLFGHSFSRGNTFTWLHRGFYSLVNHNLWFYNLVGLRRCTLGSITPFSLSLAGKCLCTWKVRIDVFFCKLIERKRQQQVGTGYTESSRYLLHYRLGRGEFRKVKLERFQHGNFIRGEDRKWKQAVLENLSTLLLGGVQWGRCVRWAMVLWYTCRKQWRILEGCTW